MTRRLTGEHRGRQVARSREDLDVYGALAAQSSEVRAAVTTAHEALAAAGVRHVLIGGIAVAAHGLVRATVDVDFLVGEEAYRHGASGVVTFREGVPIEVGGVRVDCLGSRGEPALEAVLDHPPVSAGLPIVPVEVLVHMKLGAWRPKDRFDVHGLLEVGIDADAVEAWLAVHGNDTERARFAKARAEVGA
ncbi:MAG: hypothetical protein ACOZNI_02105 [Myxococcota bacterium]